MEEDAMSSNSIIHSGSNIADLMYDVSELMINLGPRGTIKAMQHALLGNATLAGGMPDACPGGVAMPLRRRRRRRVVVRVTRRIRVQAASRKPLPWRGRRIRRTAARRSDESRAHGKFLEGSVANEAGARSYKLYVPTGYHGQPLPLVVMLHGCKQDPDDFAAGTRMNAIAEHRPCFVLYPAQARSASRPGCWNWFDAAHQKREGGEPSLIAAMTRAVMQDYRIDERRVYVAGLSAGGAMAAIMAMTYPDLFAAAAVHSGLPYRAASNVYSGLFMMRNGPFRRLWQAAERKLLTVPVIVFHGDIDTVVHPSNGAQVMRQAVAARIGGLPGQAGSAQRATSVMRGKSAEGRSYTRTVHHDPHGKHIAEHWLLHGTGHAWSGGSGKGSYTDPLGLDATHEMMRFFDEQAKPLPGLPASVSTVHGSR
jgi:poly(hydroxyalkanoate) depolymerase family esterase